MNAEDRKQFEKIKAVYGDRVGEWPNIAWLITHLEDEAKEVLRLSILATRYNDERIAVEALTMDCWRLREYEIVRESLKACKSGGFMLDGDAATEDYLLAVEDVLCSMPTNPALTTGGG